jgi:hypothetical protein
MLTKNVTSVASLVSLHLPLYIHTIIFNNNNNLNRLIVHSKQIIFKKKAIKKFLNNNFTRIISVILVNIIINKIRKGN